MRPGPHNALTDVPGLLVGQYERLGGGWATGTSVVLAPEGAVGAVDVRGGGPGTRETDLLDPSHLVQRVNAICLTGGSAYGLAAADGVMRHLGERHQGVPVGPTPEQVVPIVPAAVLFDLWRGDWGNRPDAEFGLRACAAAADGPVAQGTVGAGTGAAAGWLKGGLGTASAVLADGTVLGALVAANPKGDVLSPDGLPWAWHLGLPGEFPLRAPSPAELAAANALRTPAESRLNTTIGVIATDATLTKAEARRLAVVAHDGLARAVRPVHSIFDGDTFFALSTARRDLADADPVFGDAARAARLDELCTVAADVVSRAITHAVLHATGLPGLPAYRELFPSVVAG
ncbi:L-aminopeptidase/D-esterase-like protein [Crossiella equi]|uniref:L-aminopeptidase/D-esterase-like protein n=1 Tax=Crossiella equi TaxID=130796 RepID=A0ABS5AJI2_9PSEU|nr:P1 family peptidase [Crossiella equi]MBP2476734.1 L-aminopeptidase/D-esterase-like protein [Crossiella equi]